MLGASPAQGCPTAGEFSSALLPDQILTTLAGSEGQGKDARQQKMQLCFSAHVGLGRSLCLHVLENETTNERYAKHEKNLRNRGPAAASRRKAYNKAYGRPVAAPTPLFQTPPLRRGSTLSPPLCGAGGRVATTRKKTTGRFRAPALGDPDHPFPLCGGGVLLLYNEVSELCLRLTSTHLIGDICWYRIA